MARVYVSAGSNIDPETNLGAAVDSLREYYPGLVCSPVYESEAVGFDGDNFYNFVLAFDSDEPVAEVARRLRSIEEQHGRDRNGPRFSPRTVDLDLLLYDDLILNDDRYNIPRDEILTNAFVLQPLADIAPDLIHPQQGKSYARLWAEYDKSSQSLWRIALAF